MVNKGREAFDFEGIDFEHDLQLLFEVLHFVWLQRQVHNFEDNLIVHYLHILSSYYCRLMDESVGAFSDLTANLADETTLANDHRVTIPLLAVVGSVN